MNETRPCLTFKKNINKYKSEQKNCIWELIFSNPEMFSILNIYGSIRYVNYKKVFNFESLYL